jgi:hypothetical protein
MAESLHAPRLGLYSAWQIAQIELELGNHDSVAHWNERLAIVLSSDDDPISSSFVVAHFCRCAIDARDRAGALKLLTQVRLHQPKLPPAKASAYLLALELGCELLNGKWSPTDAQLEAAIERHRQTSRYGTTDFMTAVLGEALHRAGYSTQAREIITGYTESARREKGPLSRALKSISKKVGVV